MKCRRTSALPVLVILLTIHSASGQSLRQLEKQNAAVKYLRADLSLRQSYSLPTDGWMGLEQAVTGSLTAEDEKLVSSGEEALREFENGAHIQDCDWQVSVQDGPFASTAHRGAVRELVALAALRARIRFRDRQNEAGIQDLLAAYTAARHLSLDGSIASVLFAYRVEAEVSTVLEKSLNSLHPSELVELESGLAKLPPGSGMKDAITLEKLTRNDFLPIVRKVGTRDDLIRSFAHGIPTLNGDEKQAAEIVKGCGGSLEGVLACIEKQNAFYAEWLSRFSLSPEQFQSQYEPNFAQASIENPILARFTPSLSRLRWAEAYNATRRALVHTAVAVRREGATGLANNRDPYDGLPFEYSVLPTGFKLQSRLRENGKSLSISVE